MLREEPQSLTQEQMVSAIRYGLTKTQTPKKIIIVGAGMAGLVAASLLKGAGHHVKILEASDRVGGRVYTLRTPFSNGQYVDVGAMRFPNVHLLTMAYINKFRLPVNHFINSTPNDIIYVNGIKVRSKLYSRNPDILNYPVSLNEKGKTAQQLIRSAIQPILNFIRQDPKRNWNIVIHDFDKYSLEAFLRHNPVGAPMSPGASEMIKVLTSEEGASEISLMETLRKYMIFSAPDLHYVEVAGGNDRLAKAFLPELKRDILFRHKMVKIKQDDRQVTIHARHTKTLQPYQISGDIAVIAVPFSVLRFVNVEPKHSFSHHKWKAIRELHYEPSAKMGIQFKRRFWEEEGMFGGKVTTDLPIRFVKYPSHGFGQDKGVALASYTRGNDALIWDSISQEERVIQALKELAAIHGKGIIHDFEAGAAHSWVQYPYSAGSFPKFKPGQETELFPYIQIPEGRVHFAGEHTTTTHGWVQGAIESGIRAAYEVNERRD
ncbi:monoamine oxidase [Scopulibacillus daqui]|uniref:Monoamine oxidase n=1 Tax=Scopulibacillus daqui TaxID=1469162 RepID=A0ABS2Q1K6_9BACL|nr:flavin monoamine oxidase family protein [Scopulibacillus daqui]MBM7645412.1 monoamine oxidase [Scopulibacillus daqui]